MESLKKSEGRVETSCGVRGKSMISGERERERETESCVSRVVFEGDVRNVDFVGDEKIANRDIRTR